MLKELSRLEMLHKNTLDNVHSMRDYWLGQTLTIIDASIADAKQRKGIKDLIKNSFYGQCGYYEHLGWNFEKYAEANGLKFKRTDVYEDGDLPKLSEESNFYKEIKD